MAQTYDEILKSIEVTLPSTSAKPPVAPAAVAAPTDNLFSDIEATLPNSPTSTTPPPTTAAAPTEPTAPAPKDYSKAIYSESNLVEDEFFYPIQDYMVDRFGVHMRDKGRDEVVSMYVNNMRGFNGGNSVRSIGEVNYLNNVSDNPEAMAKAGQAYEIFEGMQGFTGETSWGEAGAMVWDYTRSAVADPINLLGLGIGKAVSGTGFKAAAQIALYTAKQTYKKKIAEGLTKELAQEAAWAGLNQTMEKATVATNIKIAKRQAIEKAATTTFQRMTTKTALKEGAVVGAFESSVAAGTDYLYQDSMLRTKVQDEYNIYQTGLAAVAGLVAGGLSGMASNVRTGASGLVAPEPLKTGTKGNQKLSTYLGQMTGQTPAGTPSPAAGDWIKDTVKGVELRDQDTKFFVTMLLGDDKLGLKGLSHYLIEDGYSWVKRNPDDKVSNWIGDIIKESDPQDAKKFLKEFVQATGIKMNDGKKLTVEALGDTFKRKMQDSGIMLNASSQMAKMFGKNNITGEEYAQFMLNGLVPSQPGLFGEASAKIGDFASQIFNKGIPDFQNNIIRLMVSNLSTTALNVAGYTTTTLLTSASDIARAALYGGASAMWMIYNPAEAKKLGVSALGILQNQMTKAKNLLDVNTTYDTFLQYAQVRPEAMKYLYNIDTVSKDLDLSKSLTALKVEQGVDFVQRVNLVSAQDGYTKALEFTTQLDKFLRRSPEEGGFGMSWNEFFSKPDHPALMQSERFAAAEIKAVDETLKATFGKSYKGPGAIGNLATIIEDARKLPGIGLLVPFGRFFNNTVAMAYDMTAILPLISKQFGGQPTKDMSEIISKGLVSWGLIYTLSLREQEYMNLGLAWNEEIDPETGAVTDQRYAFPYGALKAIARGLAHAMSGQETPAQLYTQVSDQFIGQLTRQLGDTGAGFANIGKAIFSSEGESIGKIFSDVTGTIASQAISGITRPLEPVNTAIGLARGEEFYTPDRKQGLVWANNSLRYMDQGVALVTGENVAPQKYSAASGKPRVQSTRLISTTREDRLTSTERVMNMIGKPTYLEDMASMSDAADNRYNQLFHGFVEDGARKLYEKESFRKAKLEDKQFMVENLLVSARNSTKRYMARYAVNNGDSALLKMIEISNKGRLAIDRVMKSLGMEKDLQSLSEDELDVLQKALEFREEFNLKVLK